MSTLLSCDIHECTTCSCYGTLCSDPSTTQCRYARLVTLRNYNVQIYHNIYVILTTVFTPIAINVITVIGVNMRVQYFLNPLIINIMFLSSILFTKTESENKYVGLEKQLSLLRSCLFKFNYAVIIGKFLPFMISFCTRLAN